ncbi:MAG TPA: M1 family metallopeptidase [Gemmataceae bacterium]|nr:M1 family metallopeptidase [Gemmataceae bacterium]
MNPYRLPRTVVPTRYELRLAPDLERARFTGSVDIFVKVLEPVAEIVLNAAELEIGTAALINRSGNGREARITLEEATERCRLAFPEAVPPGEWTLQIGFRGMLNDKLRGFYRSKYKDASGATRFLAATQFEATDARRAFPCWDEPAFKAVFATTLEIDPALTAVSNTAVVSEEIKNGKKVVRFADTIPMSTYLVAFVVGELEATEPTMVGRTPLRVWCVPGKRRLASFGQEVGAFSLRYFEEYYGRPYPGDKLDLLAIPDFAAGAMENLGAITFRETALLVDEQAATHAELERVADVVAHENAHMWFGDLVTMAWWNGLWLNEAFATFMEMLAVDAFRPGWQRWTTFGVSRAAALVVDGLHSTRPIEYPVAAPQDAEAMFDVLTYEKGASVLRMMEQYLGPEVFRAGVRLYLDRHAYGNAETGDLWLALGEAAGQPIPEIMDGWVFRPGYPLISVRRDGNRLVLAQQRFTYLPEEGVRGQGSGDREEPSLLTPDSCPLTPSLWHVPIQVRITADGRDEMQRVLLKEAETTLELPTGFMSVLVNADGHGFYRVRYEADLLERLLRQLPDGLSAIERFNLANDAWAAALAGLMPLTEYLELTARFRGERDKNVWAVLAGSFQALNRVIDAADRPGLEALVRDRAGPAAAELGWFPRPGESELTRQLRGDLLRILGTLGNDPDVQARAAEVYAHYQDRPAEADANVLAAAITILAHTGDASRYEEFLQRFRAAATPQEEHRYLYSLTAFQQPALVEQTLTRTLNGEIRTQDAPLVLRTLLLTVHGRERTWAFVKENWERMNQAFPPVGVRRLLEGVIGLATVEGERDVRAFVKEKQINLGGKTLEQYLEQLHIAVVLRQREAANLRGYLQRT